MPTTTNFGWTTPADTDLVKDGAAAIRTLGSGIDTSLVDLKGGTTNQVLAKNSNTDLDFKWVADATGIPATIFDAKGDLIVATAADTADRLASSAVNGQVLTVDTSTSTGLKWAAVSSAKSFSLLNAGGTSLSGSGTVTVSSLSGYDQIFVFVSGASSASASSYITFRINADTGSNYSALGQQITNGTTYDSALLTRQVDYVGNTSVFLGRMSDNAGSSVGAYVRIDGANTSGLKMVSYTGSANAASGNGHTSYSGSGAYSSSSVVSSISIISSVGNFDAGTVYVVGAA